jgi:CheY-specific phosphatase CheX
MGRRGRGHRFMMRQTSCFETVAASLANRTKSYLADQAGIDVTEMQSVTEDVDHLKLRHASAVVGLGGKVGLLIVFSFPRELVDVLFGHLTAGIQIAPDQQAVYRDATVTEVANVIVGNCTSDFADRDTCISMSPPVLVQDSKSIHRMKNAMFGTIMMATPHGSFDIHMVGPQGMFDAQLNYESEK